MSAGAQAAWLADGRLHLHHGPIDLIVDAKGPGRTAGLARATARFQSVLDELVAELALLRRPLRSSAPLTSPVARRMSKAVAPYGDQFVTPMAAVAGAVADEVLAALAQRGGLSKAYVNNGGDVAFHLTGDETMVAALAATLPGRFNISPGDPARGLATSGWRGRSQSLGIADAVSVLAPTASAADAAATLIANAVDLPRHPGIFRRPARDLAPDSDLGDRLVTVDVGPFCRNDANSALDAGASFAKTCVERGLICGAVLVLGKTHRVVGAVPARLPLRLEFAHA